MVQKIGLNGILLSTIVSFVTINIPWLLNRVFIDVFDNRYKKEYVFYLLKNTFVLFMIVAISAEICSFIPNINLVLKVLVDFLISSFVSVTIYILLNIRNEELVRAFGLINSFISKRKKGKK